MLSRERSWRVFQSATVLVDTLQMADTGVPSVKQLPPRGTLSRIRGPGVVSEGKKVRRTPLLATSFLAFTCASSHGDGDPRRSSEKTSWTADALVLQRENTSQKH